jgi:hypothetical protein
MSDSKPNLHEYLGDGADEDLVFDDLDLSELPIAPVALAPADIAETPAEAPVQTKLRRTPRRGRSSVDEAAAAEPAIMDEPVPSASVEAAPAVDAEEPAGAQPAPFPPREDGPAGSRISPLLLAIVALALLTSLLSLGGLIAVSRTLARAGIAKENALAEQAALARVPALVAHLDDATARLDAAAGKLAAASPNGPPASIADVHHEIDLLKLALDARQPQGLDALNNMTKDGFSEVTTKLDRIQARVSGAPAPSPKQDHDDD